MPRWLPVTNCSGDSATHFLASVVASAFHHNHHGSGVRYGIIDATGVDQHGRRPLDVEIAHLGQSVTTIHPTKSDAITTTR